MTPGSVRTLLATDLARSGAHVDSWRRLKVGCHSPRTGHWITSAGYAFDETTSLPATDAPHVIVVPPGPPSDEAAPAPPDGGVRPHRRLTLTTPEGPILVDVGPVQARVGIEASQWTACASPILLAIAVCWRFAEIDRFLDGLADWTRGQLPERAGGRSATRELDRRARALHSLVIDLPCYEASLDDPGSDFTSRNDARLYRRLLKGLQLAASRSRLDERIEILEGSMSYLVEDRRHRQQLGWEIALESLIIIVVLGDACFHVLMFLLE